LTEEAQLLPLHHRVCVEYYCHLSDAFTFILTGEQKSVYRIRLLYHKTPYPDKRVSTTSHGIGVSEEENLCQVGLRVKMKCVKRKNR
jgi:hypothetical protein